MAPMKTLEASHGTSKIHIAKTGVLVIFPGRLQDLVW